MILSKRLFKVLLVIASLHLAPLVVIPLLKLLEANALTDPIVRRTYQDWSVYYWFKLGPYVSWFLGVLIIYVSMMERKGTQIRWVLAIVLSLVPCVFLFLNDQDFGAFKNGYATWAMLFVTVVVEGILIYYRTDQGRI